MNAAIAKKPPSARQRLIAQPFNEYFSQRMAEAGLSNVEMAQALDYSKPNVISMLKTGAMKLPVNKVGAAARKLGIDPVFLLEKVLADSAPELWEALNGVIGDRLVTEHELALVHFVREQLRGFDANVIAYDGFTKVISPELEKIAKRESELASAAKTTLARLGRKA